MPVRLARPRLRAALLWDVRLRCGQFWLQNHPQCGNQVGHHCIRVERGRAQPQTLVPTRDSGVVDRSNVYMMVRQQIVCHRPAKRGIADMDGNDMAVA